MLFVAQVTVLSDKQSLQVYGQQGGSLCGNGNLDAGEQCDDGNNTNGDGCNALCQAEARSCSQNPGRVNFENLTTEYAGVSNQYTNSHFITFSTLKANCIEAAPHAVLRNEPQAAFLNAGVGVDAIDADHLALTGDWFISSGWVPPLQDFEPCGLEIEYSRPTLEFGLDILDLDGGEGWQLKGYDISGNVVASRIIDTDEQDMSGDGRVTSLSIQTQQTPMWRVTVEPYGLKENGQEQWGHAFDNYSPFCGTTTRDPRCGDGIVTTNTGEVCDDGNNTNGDGCSATCQIEEDEPMCGDGTVDPGEQCDDGNNTNGDGCSATCQTEDEEPMCGDGTRDAGEQCDPNATPTGCATGFTCSNTCTCNQISNPCGNGIINTGEQCDFAASPTGCPAAQTCTAQCACQANEQPQPGLAVEKVAVNGSGSSYVVGSLIPFRITIRNTGETTYTQVAFNDSYGPSYLDFTSIFGTKTGGVNVNLSGIAVVNEVSGTIQIVNLAGSNALGALAPGQNYTITTNFLARAPLNRAENCVSVSATDGSGNTRTGQDCDWVRIVNADTDL